MGHTHALSGAAAWLAVTPLLGHVTHIGPGELIAGTLVTAGAALLPDSDHPSSTLARTFGWPTRLLASGIARIAGGHRRGTHTIWAIPATAAIVQLIVTAGLWVPYAPTVAIALALGLGAQGLNLSRDGVAANIATFAACAAAAITATALGVQWAWLPVAYALGVAAHIAGDACTREGVPLFYPLSDRKYRLSNMRTGSWWEKWPIATALAAAAIALAAWQLGAVPYVAAILTAVT